MNQTIEQPTTETEQTFCLHSWVIELYDGNESACIAAELTRTKLSD